MDKIQRGISAQALLENELLKECFATLGDTYTQSWFDGKTVEAREDCHRYVTLLAKLKQDIQSIATSGKLEQARLKELEGRNKGLTLKWPMT